MYIKITLNKYQIKLSNWIILLWEIEIKIKIFLEMKKNFSFRHNFLKVKKAV